MVTGMISPETKTKPFRRSAEPTVQEIIEAARAAPIRAPAGGAWLLSGLTAVMLWASFTPLDWGPVGWICLVPLILLVRIERRTRWMYAAVYATGLFNALVTLQWMRLGHPAMYVAWVALAAYVAIYFPAFVAMARVAVHRFRLPLMIAVPLVWVGLEYLRAHLFTGFSWYYLGHSQYRWIELIQISDLVGAYGVSFVVAMTAGGLAGLVPESLFARLRLFPPNEDRGLQPAGLKRQGVSVAVCLALFAAVLAYGFVRRSQAQFREGPRIALIQPNFTASLKHDPSQRNRIFRRHYLLTGRAVKHQPDLIVWPETMFPAPLLIASPGMSDDDLQRVAPRIPPDAWRQSQVSAQLADLSKQSGAGMVIGIGTATADPQRFRHYNSAAFVRPDRGLAGRYDKLHRVLFGEYIPLKEELPWLHRLTPFSSDFGIDAGETATVFDDGRWRYAPIICFEDTVPHLVREMIHSLPKPNDGRKPVDCFVNLTNDGWFHGSSELDQHLITALFRSVECRTPMVRAVNTGVSAIIDGDGVVVEPDVFIDGDDKGRTSMRDPKTNRWHKQINAVLVDTVPLDNRTSWYVAAGDWFAATCGLSCLFFAFAGLFSQRDKKKAS